MSELEFDEPQRYKRPYVPSMFTLWGWPSRKSFMPSANKSWILVPPSEVPPGKKPTPHKWIRKFKPWDGDVSARFKGRLTSDGCSKRPGIDYRDKIASVGVVSSGVIANLLVDFCNWKFGGGPYWYQDCFSYRWSRLPHLHDSIWRVCRNRERK